MIHLGCKKLLSLLAKLTLIINLIKTGIFGSYSTCRAAPASGFWHFDTNWRYIDVPLTFLLKPTSGCWKYSNITQLVIAVDFKMHHLRFYGFSTTPPVLDQNDSLTSDTPPNQLGSSLGHSNKMSCFWSPARMHFWKSLQNIIAGWDAFINSRPDKVAELNKWLLVLALL